jgi:hypothetical protein
MHDKATLPPPARPVELPEPRGFPVVCPLCLAGSPVIHDPATGDAYHRDGEHGSLELCLHTPPAGNA